MKKYLLFSIIVFVSLLFLPINAGADTHNVTCSGSITTALQSAINDASDGDIVEVSSGSCSMGSISLPNTKGITLKGAGIGATTITGGPISFQTALGNSPARITGFTFIWGSGNFINVNSSDIGANDWRIDHVRFNYTTYAWGGDAAIWIKGWTFGVIDNCIFSGVQRGVFIEAGVGAEVTEYGIYAGDYSWTQTLDLGTPAFGYPRAVYVEDNDFIDIHNRDDQAIESRWGARYVFRYNNIQGYNVALHSGCGNGGRNSVSAEIYRNTFSTPGGSLGSYRAMTLRSTGTVIIFSNTITGDLYSAGMHMNQEESCQACGEPYSAAPYTSYYSNDQIGRKPADQSLSPWYEWANTQNDTATHLGWAEWCSALATMVQENRDFYAASTGTSAPTGACTPRAGYFATDVGQHGTLYQCTATNTWTAYYTPYTYPHPLRGGVQPQTCGNNVREGTETCDGTDLAGQTCVSRGFSGGTLACSSQCSGFVTTGCTSSQYFLPEQFVQAESGTLSGILTGISGSDTYVYTNLDNTGTASFTFNIQFPGQYRMEAMVNNKNNSGENSFYVGLDSEAAQGNVYYTYNLFPLQTGFYWDNVSRWGNGQTGDPPISEFDPMIWNLTAGIHTFTFYGREANTWLDQIILKRVTADTTPPAAPSGVRVQ